jgi:predicted metal-dependent phosphoesterase TrpH
MAFCDLHTHSTASDGTLAPGALGALAASVGVAAIALTDHDTTRGLAACAEGCRRAGVAFVPGIELSADAAALRPPVPEGEKTGTLHILGLFVRHDDPLLQEIHERLLLARQERNPQIIRNLQGLGVKIEYEEVLALAAASDTRIVGRPHIAQVMVKKGYARSVQDAFARYIGEGKAAYTRKDTLPPRQAVEAIHHAGGLAVLAHPVQLRCRDHDELVHCVTRLKALGLDGVETRHPDHTAAETEQYHRLARKLGLLVSGGSDFHGDRKPVKLGSQAVPAEVYEALLAAR